jgi:hypothetical protein
MIFPPRTQPSSAEKKKMVSYRAPLVAHPATRAFADLGPVRQATSCDCSEASLRGFPKIKTTLIRWGNRPIGSSSGTEF